MNILVVNNDTDPENWDDLLAVLKGGGHTVTPVSCRAIGAIDSRGYDAAVLSGGWWASTQDAPEILQLYAEEIRFIEEAKIPMLGICVGMLLIHVASNQAIPLLDERQYGFREIKVTEAGRALLHLPEKIEVFKNHDRGVIETDPRFEVLAKSEICAEAIVHKWKPLLGVQFHPESGDKNHAVPMMNLLLDALMRVASGQVVY